MTINNTTQLRMQELEQRQKDLEEQIMIESNKYESKITEAEFKKYYKDALKLKIDSLIVVLIKEIILYNDKINIVLNSPLKTSPENDRDLLFLYTEILPENSLNKQRIKINLCISE